MDTMKKQAVAATFVAAAAVAVQLQGAAKAEAADVQGETGTVTAYVLNVRDEPSSQGEIIGSVRQGQSLVIISKENGWGKIHYNGSEAYVSLYYVQLESANESEETGTVTASALHVRSAPTLEGKILDVVHRGETVRMIRKANGWAEIAYGEGTAYVSLQYIDDTTQAITKTVNVPALNVRSAPSMQGTVTDVIYKGQTVSVLGKEGEWAKIRHNGATAYVWSEYIGGESLPVQETGTVMAALLNVRTGPSISSEIAGRLQKGEEVSIVGTENGWAKILHDGVYRYVSLAYIHIGGAEESNNPIASSQQFARTKSLINVYDAKTGEKLTYVAGNTDLQVISITASRVYVQIENVSAYVSRSDVSLFANTSEEPASYYKVQNGKLIHYVYNAANGSYYSYEAGHAPAHLQEGASYRSFRKTAINGTESYQYFQYASIRVPSSYNAEELDAFIRQMSPDSPLNGTGKYFVEAANTYHLNASYLLAHAILESGWGTSRIARDKNNLFGFRAVDSNPYDGAASFASLQEGIDYCTSFIHRSYLTPGAWTYHGAVLGDKSVGMNVMYASDINWGEKIAALMSRMDDMLGNRDRGTYKIGIVKERISAWTKLGGAQANAIPANSAVTIKRVIEGAGGTYYEIFSDNAAYESVYVQANHIKMVSTH